MSNLRDTFRSIRRKPTVSLLAVAILAIAIGANTAVYSIVQAVLLEPLPYADPNRLVTLFSLYPETGEREFSSYPDFVDWQARSRTLTDMAVFLPTAATLSPWGDQGGETLSPSDDQGENFPESTPEFLHGAFVSPHFFSLLGVSAAHGRVFQDGDREGHNPVVLSHRLWQRRFGGDLSLVGGKIFLSEKPYTLIGVLPADFEHPEPERNIWREADYWRPLDSTPFKHRKSRKLRVIARLAQDASVASAQAELGTIAKSLEETYPSSNDGFRILVVPLFDQLLGEVDMPLRAAFFVVGLILLIACFNVAHLLLVDESVRVRETDVRMALGAERGEVVRQVLLESLVLALFGSIPGLLFARWLTAVLIALSPASTPGIARVAIDLEVLGFTLGLVLVTALLSGLIPALVGRGESDFSTLRTGQTDVTGDRRRQWLRNAVVVIEVAVAVPLLVGASLLSQSLTGLQEVQTGFGTEENALTFRLTSRIADSAARTRFFEQLGDRLGNLPGAQEVGMVSSLPLTTFQDFYVMYQAERGGEPIGVENFDTRITSGAYFEAIGIPILQGRSFDHRDNAASPLVAIVNDLTAKKLWPGENAVGQRLRGGFSNPGWMTVVGVVSSVRHRGLRQDPVAEIFLPYAQRQDVFNTMTVVVNSTLTEESLAEAVRLVVRKMDDRLALVNVASLDEVRSNHFAIEKLLTVVGVSFAILALAQVFIGLGGVMIFWVGRRTREFGMRLALGARPFELYRMVMRQCLTLVAIGLGVGLAGSVGLASLLQAVLFSVQPTDAVTLMTVTAAVMLLALASALWPARRATRVDPIRALRTE